MTKFIKSVAAAAVLATSATGAQAASLSTDVDVSLPSIIALYCYDSVSVNVSANGLSTALGVAPNGTGLGAATVTALDSDLGADAQGPVASMASAVNLDLRNVCAFRALVTNGVDVSVAQATDPKLVNASGGEIDADGISLLSASSVSTGLGLGAAATPISVRVPMDLANASAPGTYSKADLFTVTVTAN